MSLRMKFYRLPQKGEELIKSYEGKREESDLASLIADKDAWKKNIIT